MISYMCIICLNVVTITTRPFFPPTHCPNCNGKDYGTGMWEVTIDKEATMDKKMPWIVCPDKGCPFCKSGLPRKTIMPVNDLESGSTMWMEVPEKVAETIEEARNETTSQDNTSPAK